MKLLLLSSLLILTVSCEQESQEFLAEEGRTALVDFIKKSQIDANSEEIEMPQDQFQLFSRGKVTVFDSEFFQIHIHSEEKSTMATYQGPLWNGMACSLLGCCQAFYKKKYDAKYFTPSANDNFQKAKDARKKKRDASCAKHKYEDMERSYAKIGNGLKVKYWIKGHSFIAHQGKREVTINRKKFSFAKGKIYLKIGSNIAH